MMLTVKSMSGIALAVWRSSASFEHLVWRLIAEHLTGLQSTEIDTYTHKGVLRVTAQQ